MKQKLIQPLLFIALCFLMVSSCKPQKQTYLFKKMPEKWFGNWVIKSVFDSITAHDSSAINQDFRLKKEDNFITEFVIHKQLSDSVFFNIEDIEKWYDMFAYVSADTLLTKDSVRFVYDNSLQTVELTITSRSTKSVYFKASTAMLSENNNANNATVKTAFRKMFNTEFHKYSYIIADSFRATHAKKYVTFFADEKVKGLPNFSHYHMNLKGDMDNVQDAISLTLQNGAVQENFGLKNYCDSIEIYTLQLLTKADEKPMYKIDKKYITLLKQKWF